MWVHGVQGGSHWCQKGFSFLRRLCQERAAFARLKPRQVIASSTKPQGEKNRGFQDSHKPPSYHQRDIHSIDTIFENAPWAQAENPQHFQNFPDLMPSTCCFILQLIYRGGNRLAGCPRGKIIELSRFFGAAFTSEILSSFIASKGRSLERGFSIPENSGIRHRQCLNAHSQMLYDDDFPIAYNDTEVRQGKAGTSESPSMLMMK